MSAKPTWALLEEEAAALEMRASQCRNHAESLRCPAVESNGVQCTADAAPEHDHRWEEEDLPS